MKGDNHSPIGRQLPKEPPTEYAPLKTSLPLTVMSVNESPAQQGGLELPPAYTFRFADVRLIGEGGAGAVYAARDTELDRTVAIKALRHIPANTSPKELAQREARALASLRHPAIVTLYDWIATDKCAWLILEHVSGPSLAQEIIEHGRLPVAEAKQICIQVCQALQYAHDHGIWHLDIKPGNVLRTDGTIKVTDFGLSYRPGPGQTGRGWGTPGFAPPEQLAGHPVAQSDVYAAAALLWTLVTGSGNEGAGSIQKRQLWKLIPAQLRPILHAALSTHVEARPATPGDLALALQRIDIESCGRNSTLRYWDAALAGLFIICAEVLLTGRAGVTAMSPGQGIWVAAPLVALGIWRPASAVLLTLLWCIAASFWRVPTLGLMLAMIWPAMALSLRLFTRITLIVLLAPFLYGSGWSGLIPAIAGAVLKTRTAIWAAGLAALFAGGVQTMLNLPLIHLYLAEVAGNPPTLNIIGQIVNVISRISPRDILLILLPAFWQALVSPGTLLLGLTGALIATCAGLSKSSLRLPVWSGILVVLLLLEQAVSVFYGGVFSGLRLAFTCAIAWCIVRFSPK